MNQLAVARLVTSDTPTFSAKISENVALNNQTSCLTFKSENSVVPGISSYYPELEMLGQHYLVFSEDIKWENLIIHRQYTIANCMIQSFYDQLCNSSLAEAPKYEDSD